MPFEYVGVEQAMQRPGLRMVVVGGVPSLWGEAAKGILHVKRLHWVAVRLVHDSEALVGWAGQRSGPVLVHEDGQPLSAWLDILLLAEQLAPAPALLPADRATRDLVLGLSEDICAQGGLGWSRRLQLVHAGLHGDTGFTGRVAKYLGAKYGYDAASGATYDEHTAVLLEKLARRLHAQREAGSPYLAGDALTAADIYCAAAMAMFAPLPPAQCDMDPRVRNAFEARDARTAGALDPILFRHRDMMYVTHLELPLAL